MTISTDELALYDRQIRLWGLDAQQKIRNAKIAIVSTCMSGSLQELAKNLALSGFGSISVSLLEDRIEGPLIYSDLGKQLLEIHPNMSFSLKTDAQVDFSSCDFLVLLGRISQEQLESLNSEARKHGICTTWSVCTNSALFMLNDFGSFEMPASPVIEFKSFTEVFARNAAKDHRNELVKAFSTIFTDKSSEKGDCASAAIAGALISQEVVKSLSRKDLPVNNFLAINVSNLKNIICQL